jgi:hypothetical protein
VLKHVAVTLLTTLFLAAAPARGELVVAIPGTPADGAYITHDTISGLYWLNLHETTGLSFDAIQAGAGGYLADGWRYATVSEVCDLFERHLPPKFPPAEPCPATGTSFPIFTFVDAVCRPAPLQLPQAPTCAAGLLSFIGKTGFFESSTGGEGSLGVCVWTGGTGPVAAVATAGPLDYALYIVGAGPTLARQDSDPTLGHFLVRTTLEAPLAPALGPLALGTAVCALAALGARHAVGRRGRAATH